MVALVCLALQLYIIAIFGRILLSWFPLAPGGAMATVAGVLSTLTEPVLGPIRRAIPPLRMGAMGLDLSPIIVVIGVQLLQFVICG